MTREERLLLYGLALQHNPGDVFAEVGSYLGASTSFLAAAGKELGRGTVVHCVDTWQNEAMSEGLRDTWAEFRVNTKAYDRVIVPHRGRSVDIAETFNAKIDLLFLDGDHSYEGCKADFLAWAPKMRPDATLAMHDSGWAEGVKRVIQELVLPVQNSDPLILPNLYSVRILWKGR